MNLLDQPLGQIARDIAGAPAALGRLRLDWGADASRTLRDALAERGIDEAKATRALEALVQAPEQAREWQGRSTAELVEHILTRYHDAHREQLPELIRLAQRVERVHGGHPQAPVGLSSLLERMQEDLESHMQKEESILFPMILRGIMGLAVHPMVVMRREHDDHAAALEQIDRLTHGQDIAEGACGTWRSLYQGLAELKADLKDHIELENEVLFARVEGRHQASAHEENGHG